MSLTPIEQNNLVELEATIEKNLKSFYEVGFALMQIRDNKLYRENYITFEHYCKEKWRMSRPRAYQLIAAAEVQDDLSTNVDISEGQARPLAKLKDPEERREVYERAIETAPEGKVTARHIEETVKEIKGTESVNNNTEQEDSDCLFQLKIWWRRSTKKDKQIFIKWIKEA
jgi:hypothetical protein